MATALLTIPSDNPKRSLTLAQPDNLPHIVWSATPTPSL
jgi:hypothetical protein